MDTSDSQPTATRRIDFLLDEYGASHRNRVNKVIHWIFVPLIFFSIACLIWSLPFPVETRAGINWVSIAIGLVTLYYLSLSLSLALGMGAIMILCLFGVRSLEAWADSPVWKIALVIFAVSWVFQFIGHHLEGKKPSFAKDLQFLLIGPAWLLHFIYKKLGIPY
jgi:uncharacterized membrane protein YGL010W